ncbi:MAG: GldG family protein [Oscillospiraceae bacterium]|nr:GldG family protein [Oscillospiraceae bacterium]
MSEKDEIKQTPESADAPEKEPETVEAPEQAAENADAPEEFDTVKALREYAAEESEQAAETEKPEKTEKKKKRSRTPEEEKERALNSVKRRKKFKYGALATLITVVFVAIVVVVNIICGLLDKRFNWNIDLTSSGLYEIDEQTVEYLHKLNNDIKITMLADENIFQENSRFKVVAEIMNRFETESNGKIKIDYINPTKDPGAVSAFKQNYNGEFNQGDAVVQNGDLIRVVPFEDMIRTDQQFDQNTYSYVTNYSFVGEQSLVSAIMGVTDLNPVKIGMIDKVNGNYIYDQNDSFNFQRIQDLLDKNNYTMESVDISTAELTDDYDMLILCSPSTDLTEAQIAKLSDYLNNGGKYGRTLVYCGSPFKKGETKNLDDFLALWGISVGRSYAVETDDAKAQVATIALGGGQPFGGIPLVTVNPDASVNAGYQQTKLPILAPLCCPIERLYEQNSGRNTYPLLTTSDSCVLYPLDKTSDEFDVSKAEKQSVDVAVLADQTFTSGSETYKSQIVAFGSAWLFDYVIAGSAGSYDNANYFVTMLNTVTGKENVLTIAEKSLDVSQITVTDAQVKAIRTVTVLIIPLFVAVIGIFVYVRRRNK